MRIVTRIVVATLGGMGAASAMPATHGQTALRMPTATTAPRQTMSNPLSEGRLSGARAVRAITVATDGTAANSRASVERGGVVEDVSPAQVRQASCAVRSYADGSRCITATVWVAPHA